MFKSIAVFSVIADPSRFYRKFHKKGPKPDEFGNPRILCSLSRTRDVSSFLSYKNSLRLPASKTNGWVDKDQSLYSKLINELEDKSVDRTRYYELSESEIAMVDKIAEGYVPAVAPQPPLASRSRETERYWPKPSRDECGSRAYAPDREADDPKPKRRRTSRWVAQEPAVSAPNPSAQKMVWSFEFRGESSNASADFPLGPWTSFIAANPSAPNVEAVSLHVAFSAPASACRPLPSGSGVSRVRMNVLPPLRGDPSARGGGPPALPTLEVPFAPEHNLRPSLRAAHCEQRPTLRGLFGGTQ